MRSWRWYSKVLFALLVVAFAYFVWPTPWRYTGGPSGRLLRINRLTQSVDTYDGAGRGLNKGGRRRY
jgi:hypothetical protein